MQVHLTPEQEARLVELGARDGRSPEQLVREALNRFLEADARLCRGGDERAGLARSRGRFDARRSRQADRPIAGLMEVRWSPEAADDLERIVVRVRQDSPQAA